MQEKEKIRIVVVIREKGDDVIVILFQHCGVGYIAYDSMALGYHGLPMCLCTITLSLLVEDIFLIGYQQQ